MFSESVVECGVVFAVCVPPYCVLSCFVGLSVRLSVRAKRLSNVDPIKDKVRTASVTANVSVSS